MNFYVTFGQLHPLRDGYVVVSAASESEARLATFNVLGPKWAFLYPELPNPARYPLGAVGRPIEADEVRP